MAVQEIKVKLGGQVCSARLLPVDMVAFEREYGMGFAVMEADPRLEHMLWLAWHALKRTMNGQIPEPFDAFVAQVEEFDPDEEGEAKPVPPLPPPAS